MSISRLISLKATLCVVFACAEPPTQPIDVGLDLAAAASSRVVGSVSGSGHAPCVAVGFRCDPTDPDGGLRTFSFNAKMHADGSVDGRLQVKNRENGVHWSADIVCMRFTSDNRAWMIGVITNAKAGGGNVGDLTAFAVEDNGEGNSSPPDLISNLFPSPLPEGLEAALCTGVGANDAQLNFIFDALLGYGIVNGNVQVRPPSTD